MAAGVPFAKTPATFAKTLATVTWQDRNRTDQRWQREQQGHVTMVEDSTPGDDTVDLGRMLDLATPWCLHVAATLRIPEHISAGRTGIAELAAAAGCDRDALHAVLGHLVAKGVFAEESPGRFVCNRPAEELAAVPFLDLDGIGGRMAHTWGTLLDYVRTGQPAYRQVFGRPFWEDLAAHPQIAAEFDALMGPAGHGIPDFDIELSDGWDQIRTVVDVGGGTGVMLASLLRRHPQTKGILVDLPGTVARAGEVIDSFGVSSRMTVTGQSFFDPLPAGADLYLLKSVLNDWADEPTVAILRRCAEAAAQRQAAQRQAAQRQAAQRQAAQPKEGTIAILGGVSGDETPHSLGIDMLVAGGKTSTLTQFAELARQAGLEIVAARTQSSGRYVVECQPASPPGQPRIQLQAEQPRGSTDPKAWLQCNPVIILHGWEMSWRPVTPWTHIRRSFPPWPNGSRPRSRASACPVAKAEAKSGRASAPAWSSPATASC